MNAQQIRRISQDRVNQWVEGCVTQHSTPALIVCVGHDHNSGVVDVRTVKEMCDENLLALARFVVKHLEGRIAGVPGSGLILPEGQ